jgi:hypothetical protein
MNYHNYLPHSLFPIPHSSLLMDCFFSPEWVGEILVKRARIEPNILTLEPSAGTGLLAQYLAQSGANVHCIEPILDYQTMLTKQGFLVIGSNFLTTPNLTNKYPRIVANLPFSQQISHLKRAYHCLEKEGRLVALMSETPWKYNRVFYQHFRYWCQQVNAIIEELPSGLFVNSSRYTEVNCYLIVIDKKSD